MDAIGGTHVGQGKQRYGPSRCPVPKDFLASFAGNWGYAALLLLCDVVGYY